MEHAQFSATPITAVGENGYVIDIAKGSHLALSADGSNQPRLVFVEAVMGSLCRGGKPVRCTNFLNGISLLVEAGPFPYTGEDAEAALDHIYRAVEPRLMDWLLLGPSGEPLCCESLGVTARFAHRSHLEWLPGVFQVDVADPLEVSAMSRIDTPSPKARGAPQLVTRSRVEGNQTPELRDPTALKPGDVAHRTPATAVVERAIDSSFDAIDGLYRALPMPIRFRASGAIEAWSAARSADGRPGAELGSALADPKNDPFSFVTETKLLVLSHTQRDWQTKNWKFLDGMVATSVPNMAFWLRKGALYEPPESLEQLLKMTDVASDMPLAALTTGARALCIVPGRSVRHGPEGIDSLMLFEHTGLPADSANERWLTFIASKAYRPGEAYWSAPVLRVRVENEHMSIHDAIAKYCTDPHGYDPNGEANGFGSTGFWNRILSYAFKVLSYLSTEQAQVRLDAAYSRAPRNFSGLGKRKKHERLREIEQLYDRYIVGPEGLSPLYQQRAQGTRTGEGGEISPHWRRGHFRLQHYGTGHSKNRVIFIMPVIVRADRLGLGGPG